MASHEIVTATTSPLKDRHSLLTTPEIWRFTNAKGEESAVRPHGQLRGNNSHVMLYSLRSGHGIAVVPDFIIDTDLASGAVVPILEDWRPQPVALHLATPPGTIRPARVAALIEYLAARLGSTTGG
jgi:DNA-binding transcriptional LysR family regulator